MKHIIVKHFFRRSWTGRLAVAVILGAVIGAGAYAQADGAVDDPVYAWGSFYNPGNLILQGAGRFDTGPAQAFYGFTAAPTAELIVAKPTGPLDIGLAVTGRAGAALFGDRAPDAAIGVGGLATAHLGLRGLGFTGLELIERLDFFLALGLGFDILPYSTDARLFGLPLSLIVRGGVNYFVNDRFSVHIGTTTWNRTTGAEIGASFRTGTTPTVDDSLAGVALASQAGILLGSYYFALPVPFIDTWYHDFRTYDLGQGTVWEFTSSEYDDVVQTERAVVSADADGGQWRSFRWTVPEEEGSELAGDTMYFELRAHADETWDLMRFTDFFTGRAVEYRFEPGSRGAQQLPTHVQHAALEDTSPEEAGFQIESRGVERVTVGAGTFSAEHFIVTEIADEPEEFELEFWVTDEVPGRLIRTVSRVRDEGETVEFYGELVRITSGNSRRF